MLASGHFGAIALLRKSEDEIHLALDELYGVDKWKHYETNANERSIDVFGVLPKFTAAEALLRKYGFSKVGQHSHDYAEFRRCACEWAFLMDEEERSAAG